MEKENKTDIKDGVRLESRTSYKSPPQFLNKKEYVHVNMSKLPHWHQDCKMQFVTFRLADSLPQVKLHELSTFKEHWLSEHPQPWSKKEQEDYDKEIRDKCDRWIDEGYGSCILKDADIREIVEEALLHYDGIRYEVYAYVIMPNHVHILLSPIIGYTITEVIGKLKGYTARVINKKLGRNGSVWQKDIFDRLVRDVDNYAQYLDYIRNNPCHLPSTDYTLSVGASAFQPTKKKQ